jgi:hypothetical protein
MQWVEVDDVHGLRAAVITFASDASSLRFVLVPISPLGAGALRGTARDAAFMRPGGDRGACVQPAAGRQAAGPGVEPAVGAAGRGRHMNLDAPPDSWDGVDRPFITAPAVPTSVAASRDARRARIPVWLVPLEPFRPLVAMAVSRYVTRVLVGHVVATHARQAVGSNPSGPGFLDAYCRYWAAQVGEVVRQLHTERHGRTLRDPASRRRRSGRGPAGVARTLGGLGYSPGEVDWMTVFSWLPGDTLSEGPRSWVERVVYELYRAPKAYSRAHMAVEAADPKSCWWRRGGRECWRRRQQRPLAGVTVARGSLWHLPSGHLVVALAERP